MSRMIVNRKSIVRSNVMVMVGLLVCACEQRVDAPSRYISHPDDANKRVEYFIAKPAGAGPWPTVVFLHGHQKGFFSLGGKAFAEWGVLEQFASRGYLAVAVSQPGYGDSTGPADYCGPFTQHAVTGVIASLRTEGLALPQNLVIQGVSRGALTAGLVAATDTSVSGIVLISGVYDLLEYTADSEPNAEKAAVIKSLIGEAGGTEDALRARSILHVANNIKAKTLILNGAKDDRTDPNQARRLAKAIVNGGGDARAIVYPNYGHKIPVEVRNLDIAPFIDDVLQHKVPPK